MFFQIKEIILWPKNKSKQYKRLSFELSKVNIITGSSKTGKSAIIPIIDYCLGSGKCSIPVNTIRDACEWFGIIIQTSMGQKLFARREPGQQRASDNMYILEGEKIEVPETIENKNSSREDVKRLLDEFVGLTDLNFDIEGSKTGYKARPSFRDLSAFLFQPQNLIANPNSLFFKADTYEHRQKLITIFPYILNAVTPQMLAKQHELEQLKKELNRNQRELDTIRQISERWQAEIQAKISEASELGLIKGEISPTASQSQLMDILNQVVHSHSNEIQITSETISEAVKELIDLQKEESHRSIELSTLRKRFADMSSLKESAKQYREALQIHRDRLKISEWLRHMYDINQSCPMCGNSLESATMGQLNILCNSLKKVESEAGEFDKLPAAFDREFERVRSEIRIVSEKLQGIRIRREALEKSSKEAKQVQYDSLNISRFIGNLEQSLKIYSNLGRDSKLEQELQELRIKVNDLEKEISEEKIFTRTRRALDRIKMNAGNLLPFLDAERPKDPISLLIKDLTIQIQGKNRNDYLWEIGSGANWLSYHIAVLLGMHEYFMSLTHSPIPGFIVLDQPSQVYFPKKLAIREGETEESQKIKDEDLEAVKRFFQVFSKFISKSEGKFQILVLEHAGEDAWKGVKNIFLVDEWGKDNKLVPNDWTTT